MSLSRLLIFAIGAALALLGLYIVFTAYTNPILLIVGIALIIVGVVLISGKVVTI